jgi:hypothetical protein
MGLGEMEIDSNTAGVTVSVAFADTDPDLAVITLEPNATALASPELGLTVATVVVPEVQLTLPVKSAVLLSENVPVALNCCVKPSGSLGALGVTTIDTTTAGVGVDEPPPQAARISSVTIATMRFKLTASIAKVLRVCQLCESPIPMKLQPKDELVGIARAVGTI